MTTNTTKQTITVEVPKGFEALSIDINSINFSNFMNSGVCDATVLIQKKKPIRRVFELVSDERQQVKENELFSMDITGHEIKVNLLNETTSATYYLWREIKGEGDD